MTPWLTPQASDSGKGERSETFVQRNGDRTMGCYQSLSSMAQGFDSSASSGRLMYEAGWPVAEGVEHRVAKLRAAGNAIVPKVAYTIFDAIQRYEDAVSEQEAA